MKSLLELILEEIEYEKLIEEGKDPVELLHYKFQNVPSNIIDKVIDIDPTKKKSYSQWLLSHYNDESNVINDNLDNGRIEQLFQHYKSHSDIQIKDCPSVEEGLRKYVPEVDTVLTKSSKPTTYIENIGEDVSSELANDFDVVFNEDDWLIAVPNTYEAECKLGENTRWCTANEYGSGESYYNRYVSDGPLYVNFDMSKNEVLKGKEYPFTRYQFHFQTHQFCDTQDSVINVNDTNIPESAMQFYESKGYNTEDFEDLDVKIERYEEQRWQCMFRIFEDLYLNIQYDSEYEFEEPNENTDFYLYDENDDRDPIDWTDFANPHLFQDDVVIEISEEGEYALLKGNGFDDNKICLVIRGESNVSRNYSVYEVENLIKLDEYNLFGVCKETYCLFSYGGYVSECETIIVKNSDSIFINESLTSVLEENGVYAIEAIENQYHSLFIVDTNETTLSCAIKRDIPVNGNYFTMSENGLIEGEFKNHKLFDDDEYDDPSYIKYDLEKEIDNNKYLISTEIRENGKVKTKFNILMKGSTEPILEEWFDNFYQEDDYFYWVLNNEKQGVFNKNGKHLGGWYGSIGFDNKNGFAFCSNTAQMLYTTQLDVISVKDDGVIASFKRLLSTSRPLHGEIIVIDNDDNVKFFNYIYKQFTHNEFENVQKITQNKESYLCKLKGEEEYVIYGFNTNSIISQNVKELKRFDGINLIRIIKTNEKQNIFDLKNEKELFPNDIDFATYMNENIFYSTNGKYYLYNWNDNKFLINQNGFPEPTKIENNSIMVFENESAMLTFRIGYRNAYLSTWTDKTQNKIGTYDRNMTPIVASMYNTITGQQETNTDTQTPSYSVAEEFTRILNKLNEAKKLLW